MVRALLLTLSATGLASEPAELNRKDLTPAAPSESMANDVDIRVHCEQGWSGTVWGAEGVFAVVPPLDPETYRGTGRELLASCHRRLPDDEVFAARVRAASLPAEVRETLSACNPGLYGETSIPFVAVLYDLLAPVVDEVRSSRTGSTTVPLPPEQFAALELPPDVAVAPAETGTLTWERFGATGLHFTVDFDGEPGLHAEAGFRPEAGRPRSLRGRREDASLYAAADTCRTEGFDLVCVDVETRQCRHVARWLANHEQEARARLRRGGSGEDAPWPRIDSRTEVLLYGDRIPKRFKPRRHGGTAFPWYSQAHQSLYIQPPGHELLHLLQYEQWGPNGNDAAEEGIADLLGGPPGNAPHRPLHARTFRALEDFRYTLRDYDAAAVLACLVYEELDMSGLRDFRASDDPLAWTADATGRTPAQLVDDLVALSERDCRLGP